MPGCLRFVRAFSAALLFVLVPVAGMAQAQPAYPDRPVRLIVPFPPGGAADVMMRSLGSELERNWRQPVVVENKPGAGTIVATGTVARAQPDGYTAGLVVSSHAINVAAGRSLPYDTLKDLVPVTQLAVVHQGIFARVDSPLNSAKDLVEYSRSHPRKLTFGTAGVGTAGHLLGELMNANLGTSLVHVAYKGSGPAKIDLLAGNVDLMIDALAAQYELVQAGKLKVIALVSPERHPEFKELPTMAESYPGISVVSFFGIVVPSGTPAPIVGELQKQMVAALNSPAVKPRLSQLGLVPVGSSAKVFDDLVRSEIARWSDLFTRTGLKVD